MVETNIKRRTTRLTANDPRIVMGLALVIAASYLFASAFRGVWYDENWSLYFSQHDLPLHRVITDRWLHEINPPLSFLLGWLVAPVAGDSLLPYRLTNLVPALLLIATLIRLAGLSRSFRSLFGLLIFANPSTIRYFADFRSYFGQTCCAAALVAAAYSMLASERDLQRRDAKDLALPAIATLVLLNLHYVGAYLSGVLLGTLITALLLAGKPRFAGAVLGVTIIGLSAAGVSYLAQHETIVSEASSISSWNYTSNSKALGMVAGVLALAIGPNLAALWGALSGSKRAFTDGTGASGLRRFARWAVVAILAMALAALALNFIRPALLPRYLSVLAPVAIGPIAALAAVASKEAVTWLILGNAAVLAAASGYKVAQQQKWSAGARFIAEQVRRCPGTIVHTVPHWQLEPGQPTILPNEIEMNQFAYERLGRIFGFQPEAQGSGRVSDVCPTIIWTGHYYASPPSPSWAAARVGLRISRDVAKRSHSFVLGDGMLVLFPPVRNAAAA